MTQQYAINTGAKTLARQKEKNVAPTFGGSLSDEKGLYHIGMFGLFARCVRARRGSYNCSDHSCRRPPRRDAPRRPAGRGRPYRRSGTNARQFGAGRPIPALHNAVLWRVYAHSHGRRGSPVLHSAGLGLLTLCRSGRSRQPALRAQLRLGLQPGAAPVHHTA